VTCCEFGAILGTVLAAELPTLARLNAWPYWEAALHHKPSGSLIPPFHWSIKKMSVEYCSVEMPLVNRGANGIVRFVLHDFVPDDFDSSSASSRRRYFQEPMLAIFGIVRRCTRVRAILVVFGSRVRSKKVSGTSSHSLSQGWVAPMKRCSLEHFQQYLRWALIGALMCVLLAANLVTPLFFDSRSELLMGLFVGICIGQVNLIAAWAALAPGNVLFRLPWSMLLGVLMWYSLVLGYRLQELLGSLGVVSSHSDLEAPGII